MRSELDIYNRMTIKCGGVWCMLAESVSYRIFDENGYSVYKVICKCKKSVITAYKSPTYQMYNTGGKMIYTSANLAKTMGIAETMAKLKRLIE